MSKDRELFHILCRLLTAPADDSTVTIATDRSDLDWDRLVYIASLHHAAPLLYDALARRPVFDRLPDDVRGHLLAIRHANAERNDDIRRQIEALLPALNAAGVEPLVLKGAAFLIDDPGYAASRMMLDVDLLMPPGSDATAAAVMEDQGYVVKGDPDGSQKRPTTAMYNQNETAVVEIHRAPVDGADMLTAAEAFESGAIVNFGGARCRLLSPTHRVLHTIYHGQVSGSHFAVARPQLRILLDLRRFGQADDSAIDWSEIQRRFDDVGNGDVAQGTRALLAAWLGVAPPEFSSTPQAQRYVDRCAARLDQAERKVGPLQHWIGRALMMVRTRSAPQRRVEETAAALARRAERILRQPTLLERTAAKPVRPTHRDRQVDG